MKARRGTFMLIAIVFFGCSSVAQGSPTAEIEPPTSRPTFTQVTVTAEPENTPTPEPTISATAISLDTANIHKTILKFEFPFEPTIGYSIDIRSATLTTSVLCALGGQATGEVLDMVDSSKKWGTCDKSSVTLDIGIPDQMTVTVILGGIPFINEETKSPSLITEEQIEYTFEVNL